MEENLSVQRGHIILGFALLCWENNRWYWYRKARENCLPRSRSHSSLNDVTEDNILDEYESPYDNDDDDDDDDDGEGLSVSDAADIWRSHGEDEDYMFGYTREELEDA